MLKHCFGVVNLLTNICKIISKFSAKMYTPLRKLFLLCLVLLSFGNSL